MRSPDFHAKRAASQELPQISNTILDLKKRREGGGFRSHAALNLEAALNSASTCDFQTVSAFLAAGSSEDVNGASAAQQQPSPRGCQAAQALPTFAEFAQVLAQAVASESGALAEALCLAYLPAAFESGSVSLADVVSIPLQHRTLFSTVAEFDLTRTAECLRQQGLDLTAPLPPAEAHSSQSFMHLAAGFGAYYMVGYALNTLKVDVNQRDQHGNTPLILAARGHHSILVDVLLSVGADAKAQNELRDTALIAAIRSVPSSAQQAQARQEVSLVACSQRPQYASCQGQFSAEVALALIIAFVAGHAACCEFLVNTIQTLAAGPNSDPAALDETFKTFRKQVVSSSALGLIGSMMPRAASALILERLLNSCTAMFGSATSARIRDRMPNMFLPAYLNQPATMQLVAEWGADLDATDETSRPPLVICAVSSFWACLRVLITAEVDLDAHDLHGTTALHWATINGAVDIVQELLAAGADVNHRNSAGSTTHIAAAAHNHVACLEALLAAGAEVNTVNNQGTTALIAAAEAGHTECVQVLLRHGCELNHQNRIGMSALMYAAHEGNMACLTALLEAGAATNPPPRTGSSPLIAATVNSKLPCMAALLEAGAQVDWQDENGISALMCAAGTGHMPGVRLLLDRGAQLNLRDCEGVTAITAAGRQERLQMVKFMIARGAVCDICGITGLFRALRRCSQWEVVVETLGNTRQLTHLASSGDFINLRLGEAPADAKLRNVALCMVMEQSNEVVEQMVYNTDPAYCLQWATSLVGLMAFLEAAVRAQPPAQQGDSLWDDVEVQGAWDSLVTNLCEHEDTVLCPGMFAGPVSQQARLGSLISALQIVHRICSEPDSWHAVVHSTFLTSCREQLNSAVAAATAADPKRAASVWTCSWAPDLLTVSNKLALLRGAIAVTDTVPAQRIAVSRLHVLDDMCKQWRAGKGLAGELRQGIDIQMADEPALGSGLRREWFRLVAQEALSAERSLFASTDGGRTFQPASDAQSEDDLAFFELFGRVVGLALLHGETLPGAHFTHNFRKALLGQPLVLEDLAAVDEQLYQSIVGLQTDECDVEDMCLTFTAYDVSGNEVELLPNGSEVEVTRANLASFVELLTTYKLLVGIQPQLAAFVKGLTQLMPQRIMELVHSSVRPEDLDIMIAGRPKLDLEDWRAHTQYRHCTAETEQVQWLWEAIAEMPNEQRVHLLQFVTASSSVPAGGFACLSGFNGALHAFEVCLVPSEGDSRLPRAATCFNTLYLPLYSSKGVLQKRIEQACSAAHVFDEGAITGPAQAVAAAGAGAAAGPAAADQPAASLDPEQVDITTPRSQPAPEQ
ncbi:hypothetical protein WJX72_000455 [[Myrmecia] bisecta]|uniref:E3 ubiquitin-protein ligase HACE1 n=1 Tax=[Myrmecia] bisecta TaxID=41462 RepID=A0AAW1Q075_9CHLO